MRKPFRQWKGVQPNSNLVLAEIERLPRLGSSRARRLRSHPHIPARLWPGTLQRDYPPFSVRPADRIEMIVGHSRWIAAGELRLNQGGCIGCVAAHDPGEDARCCGICPEVGWRQCDDEFNRSEATRHVQAEASRGLGTSLQPTEYVVNTVASDHWQRWPTITATSTAVTVNSS